MSKLYDIKGYWDSSYEYQFNDKDMWEGKIKLEDDGWFEGVVKDVNSSYTEDRFVFGVYHPDKVMELFKWTQTSYSSPFVFHARKSDDGYQGEFEIIGFMGSVPYGVSRVITEEMILDNDEEKKEIDDLMGRITRYKLNLMDSIGKEFYNNTIAIRNSICEVVLRNYEGRGFSDEEAQTIMEECGPINDRVSASMQDAVKKYIKEMPNRPSNDSDDDLPF